MKIRTPRLLIREFINTDAASIHAIAQTDGFDFYSLDGTYENARQFVQNAIDMQHKGKARTSFKMAVTQIHTPDSCIGYVAFDDLHASEDGTPDIGYLIDPQFQGKGFATEAMGALMDRCYQERANLNTSWLTVHPDNIASQKVACRLSFQRISDDIIEKAYGPRYIYKTNRDTLTRAGVIQSCALIS